MKNIKVPGTGRANCKATANPVEEAARAGGVPDRRKIENRFRDGMS